MPHTHTHVLHAQHVGVERAQEGRDSSQLAFGGHMQAQLTPLTSMILPQHCCCCCCCCCHCHCHCHCNPTPTTTPATGTALVASAFSVAQLVIGRLVLGVGVGLATQATPLYLSEMAPYNLRGTHCPLMWPTGQLWRQGQKNVFMCVRVTQLSMGWRL
jgi:hypothetical protein